MLPCRACLVPVPLLLLLLLRGPLPVSCLHVDADAPAPAPATATAHRQDGAAWRSFQQLLDARRGSRVAGLADLKRYLARFGYMPGAEQHEPATDAFDAHMEAAVRRYQSALSLPVTGQLDSATLDRIMAPRCGVGDTGHGAASVALTAAGAGPTAGGAVSRFTFFKGEPRWTQPDPLVLTYAISTTATVDYLPAEAVARRVPARVRAVGAGRPRGLPRDRRLLRGRHQGGLLRGQPRRRDPLRRPARRARPRLLPQERPAPPRRGGAVGDRHGRGNGAHGRRLGVRGHARDRTRPRAGALVVAQGRHVPEPQAAGEEGGAHRRRRRRRPVAVRAQPRVQSQLALPAGLLHGDGEEQLARWLD